MNALKYAVAALVLVVAGWAIHVGAEQTGEKKVENRVFELRVYYASTGKMNDLHARFKDARLPRRGDDLGLVAIGEHGASPAWPGPALADRRIEVLGGRDLKALHPRPQCLLGVGLDEQVDVRALDADVHDPKVFATLDSHRVIFSQ